MRSRLAANGATTGLVTSSMLSGGVARVPHVQPSVDGFVCRGHPLHFVALGEQDALAEAVMSHL